MRKIVLLLALAIALAAAPASAQEKRFTVNLGGGASVPLSDVGDYFGTGFNVVFGVTVHLNDSLGIQAEYQYNGLGSLDGNSAELPSNPIEPPIQLKLGHNMNVGNFNLVFKPRTRGRVGGYMLGGGGIYHRRVDLSTPGTGLVTVCNPWWYICYPTPVPVDRIIGTRSSTDFGVDVGGGMTFLIGDTEEFYVEARYHYVWGPEVDDGQGNKQKANGQYLPITFGFRF